MFQNIKHREGREFLSFDLTGASIRLSYLLEIYSKYLYTFPWGTPTVRRDCETVKGKNWSPAFLFLFPLRVEASFVQFYFVLVRIQFSYSVIATIFFAWIIIQLILSSFPFSLLQD